MSRFEVDSARVEEASTQVRGSVAAITTEVDRMMRHLDGLQSVWRGQAATGFAEVAAQWRSTQQQVRDALEQIQVALGEAGRQYADTEAATARMFLR